MKHSQNDESAPRWQDTFAYPDEIISGSSEHRAAHRQLLELIGEKETDFEPWGRRKREGEKWQDCSCGCRHYATLAGPLGADWGVCLNSRSRRAGLLTLSIKVVLNLSQDPNL
jgi:hypothetical protein